MTTMEILGSVLGGLVTYALVMFGVRAFGLPSSLHTFARWVAILLAASVVLDAIRRGLVDADTDDVPGGGLAMLAAMTVFGLVGAFRLRGARERASALAERNARARALPRRRALPPAPHAMPWDRRGG